MKVAVFNLDSSKPGLLHDAGSASRGLWLLRLLLACLVLLYAAYLFRGEVQASAARSTVLPVTQPSEAPQVVAVPLNFPALVTVLGLQAQGPLARSSEALRLQASFITRDGESRALLAGSSGAQVYRVGERLPGGSVLRRVEPGHVVLWRNGREESLVLGSGGSSTSMLRESVTPGSVGRNPHRFIRPLVDPLQSD